MNNIFIIVTGNRYPNGDAGAIRQHSFAKIIKELGFRPFIISLGESTDFKIKEYEGIEYCSLRYKSQNIIFRILGRLLFAKNVIKKIRDIKTPIVGILIVSGGQSTFKYVKQFAIKNKIALYHDSVEWFSPCEFKNGDKSVTYRKQLELNTRIIDSNFKVFAISRYLQEYFQNRGVSTIRVPVIVDTENIVYSKKTDNTRIKIVYAGQVGGKDHLSEFIEALSLLQPNEQNKFQFCMIGITKEAYESFFGDIDDSLIANEIVKFLGRIDRNEVLEHLRTAHFTMLLRPHNEIYSKAGFPTKVVESLSTGTPVICNLTSDLEMYLNQDCNCILVDSCTTEACKKALLKIYSMKLEDIEKMQYESRKSAELYFNYKRYIELFDEFLEN